MNPVVSLVWLAIFAIAFIVSVTVLIRKAKAKRREEKRDDELLR